ncbi:MAG: DUF58 domain-containing protein, partial [Elusimicrobia bacterium]|nr:DUF58 domain-containing protein [Elusimicrobiota bacterium]
PDRELSGQAYASIYAALARPDRADRFLERLKAAQAKHAADAQLQLGVEALLLQRLADPAAKLDAAAANAVLTQVFAKALEADKARAAALAKAKPGQKIELPPSLFVAALSQLSDAVEGSSRGGQAPAALAALAKLLLNEATGGLIREAEGLFPGLHETLREAGVTLPDKVNSRWIPERGSWGEIEDPEYRVAYKLKHVRDFAGRLDKTAATAGKLSPRQAEFMARALKALEGILAVGPAVGMLEGGSPGEYAADTVNAALQPANSAFSGSHFLKALRGAGLAPDNGAQGDAAWRESYGAQDLLKLRDFLAKLAASGQGWEWNGTARPLTSTELPALTAAIDAAEQALKERYPAEARAAGLDPAARAASQAQRLLASADAAERAAARADFLKALDAPGASGLALARIALAGAATVDHDAQLWLLQAALDRSFGPGRAASPEALAAFLRDTSFLDAVLLSGRGLEAMEALRAAAARATPEQRKAAQPELEDILHDLFAEALTGVASSLPGFDERLAEAGAKSDASTFFPRLKLLQLRAASGVIEKALAEGTLDGRSLDESQRASLVELGKRLAAYARAAEAAGVGPGDSPAEQVGLPVQRLLHELWRVFPGYSMGVALAREGLRPRNAVPNNPDEGYYDRYTKEDLAKIRRFLGGLLSSGIGWSGNDLDNDRRPLTAEERALLEKSVKELDRLLREYPQAKAPAKGPAGATQLLHGFGVLGLGGLGQAGPAISPSLGALVTVAALAAAAVGIVLAIRAILKDRRALRAAERRAELSEDVERRMARIELTSGRLSSSMSAGAFRSAYKGKGGYEAEDFREYSNNEGDEFRDINWKLTAKEGKPIVNLYEQERDLPVMLFADLSRSADRAAVQDIAATLALAAAKRNLRVGAYIVTDQIHVEIPPKGGMEHARELARRLLAFEAPAGGTDLRPALEQALALPRSLVVPISDFLAPPFGDQLAALWARGHALLPIRVVSPALKALPAVGWIALRDAETGAESLVDTSDPRFQAQAPQRAAALDQGIQRSLDGAMAETITLSTEDDYLQGLEAALSKGSKQ